MGQVNYKAVAETLADALYAILELSIGTELADALAFERGWQVWGDYFELQEGKE